MIILIPCKNLDRGKSRLASHLDSRSRRALCELFLCQTLALATSVLAADQVRVITEDSRAAAIGADHGVGSIPDRGIDLNTALEDVRQILMSDRSQPDVMVLPIDLPYATPTALKEVLKKQRAQAVIVPNSAGLGTNLLFLKFLVFRRFPFAYGTNSFQRHLAAARSVGHTVEIVNDERLAFDVDQPLDYQQWLEAVRSERGLRGHDPMPVSK
jgi:2-phospho-L-lactate/phosphoenolpyruvate guanylyltransferase